jgi:hypothetical protein
LPAVRKGPPAGALAGAQPLDDPVGQSPLDKQGPYLRHAEVAVFPLVLPHDVQQDRPFARHEYLVVPASFVPGADEIVFHEGLDLVIGQSDLTAAARIGPLFAVGGEARQFVLMHLPAGIEDARARAMLVQRTVAQRVEFRAGPQAA